MTGPKPDHPLLISDVMRRAGVNPTPSEEQMSVRCPTCRREVTLAEMTIEPATDPHDITNYVCPNGCGILALTGYPSPIPLPNWGRYRLGDFSFASLGIQIAIPRPRSAKP